MNSDEVRFWFEQAAEVSPEGRAAFLKRHCTDEDVRSEVLSVLEYDTEEPVSPPAAIRDAIDSFLRDERSGAPIRVGAFELGRLLGSGGMGFVYEGQRVDGEVRQRVAVKFAQVSPRAGAEFRQSVQRRFARERQVLASLRHPYIAGLIDAGTTPDGVPYAVIEQVDGTPIDSYCDEKLLDPADRIRLVLKLCDAVQFAHRNLIVHSDIKPGNILVTADGIPKLIDFGVASDLAEESTLPTLRAFTPGYASPEQFCGLPATVLTDVYGIGAVLYRLLTGAKPREMGDAAREDTVRNIWEGDVQKPSSIQPELKGDLENILLRALQRDPQRRYGSVPELADDLNRFLARRPVRASPDSLFYRLKRFVRRHWVVLGAAMMLAASLGVAAAISFHQRRIAVSRAAETRKLAERLMFEVHDEIRGVLGGTRARERLGNIAVQYLEGLERNYGRDPELAWELLNAYARLGQSRGGIASSVGDTVSGSRLAMKTLALGAVVESSSPVVERLDRLFTLYEGLVPILLDSGRRAEQREAVDRLIKLARRLSPVREAQAFKQLARYYDAAGAPQPAADAWARSLAILRRLSEIPGSGDEISAQLPSTLVGFGRAQALNGDFAGAVASFQEAIRQSEASSATEPQMARGARQLYWSHIGLGDVYGSPGRFSLGRAEGAAAEYRKAQRIAERLVNADQGNEMARLDLARAFSREGMALAALEPERALALMERSWAEAAHASSRNHSSLDSRFEYLTASVQPLARLGHLERAKSRLNEARGLARKMREEGRSADERTLLRAEAILLEASGQRREALATAFRHLKLLPDEPRPVLSENFGLVDLLERMRGYAVGLDADACTLASERLVRTWEVLSAANPQSAFVRGQAERARTLAKTGCQVRQALTAPH